MSSRPAFRRGESNLENGTLQGLYVLGEGVTAVDILHDICTCLFV